MGTIGNINRQRDAELARGCIGDGILIHADMGQNGNISYFLTNVSNSQVFVQVRFSQKKNSKKFQKKIQKNFQSPACNIENKWHYATVVKVPSSCQLKIFSDDWFQRILNDESNQARQGALN